MNYLFYGSETFSLSAIQAIDEKAKYQLLPTDRGTYGMQVSSVSDGEYFVETEITGLAAGKTYTLNFEFVDILSNSFRVYINPTANDNSNPIVEEGWGKGKRSITFVAPQDTIYFACGDLNGITSTTYLVLDNVSLKDNGTELVLNGTFETDMSGWYSQNTNSTIAQYEYAPVGDNPYFEPINIPDYDSNNSTHYLITNSSGWNEINNSAYQHFYVQPGANTSGTVTITASGTSLARKSISLHNGNDTHPGKLPMDYSNLAAVSLYFNGASYWDIDRMSYLDAGVSNVWEFVGGSSFNTLNRCFTYNNARSVRVLDACNNNTIQRCRFGSMTLGSRKSDMTAIEALPEISETMEIKNLKLIANEIVNANDPFQSVTYWSDEAPDLNGEGLIIDSNHFYITDDLYTDCEGVPDTTGWCSYSENAVDLKFGSSNPDNPVIITNNHFWGYRMADNTDSYVEDMGGALVVHYGIKNTIMENNVIFDSNMAFSSGDPRGYDYGIGGNSTFKNNLIYQCATSWQHPWGTLMDIKDSGEFEVTNNEIFDCDGMGIRLIRNGVGFVYRDNIQLDCAEGWYDDGYSNDGAIIEYHPANDDGSGNYVEVTAESQGYTEDYTFTTDNYTNNPRQITLHNVINPNKGI